MRKLTKWLRERNERPHLEGEVVPTYTESDVRNAIAGHMPLAGTDLEVVAYRVTGSDDLMLAVNKAGILIFRAKLVGAAKEAVPMETLWQWNIHAFDKPIIMGEPSEDLQRLMQEMIEKK
jgi:hypothetical protein